MRMTVFSCYVFGLKSILWFGLVILPLKSYFGWPWESIIDFDLGLYLFWSREVNAWVGGNSTVQAEVGGFYARSQKTCPSAVEKSLWNEWTGEDWVESKNIKIDCGK